MMIFVKKYSSPSVSFPHVKKCLSAHPSICLWFSIVCQPVSSFQCLSAKTACLPANLPSLQPTCLHTSRDKDPNYLSVHLSVYPAVCLLICSFIHLSSQHKILTVVLLACLFVCCLSTCYLFVRVLRVATEKVSVWERKREVKQKQEVKWKERCHDTQRNDTQHNDI